MDPETVVELLAAWAVVLVVALAIFGRGDHY